MNDQECAAILRRICDSWPYHGPTFAKEHAALERAIELLEASTETPRLDWLIGPR